MTRFLGNNLPLTWFRQFRSCWAATVATYCPGRMAEHSKSKSLGGCYRGNVSPSTTLPDVNLFDNFPRLVGHQLEELAARDARLAARPVPGSLAQVVVGRSRGNAVILGSKRNLYWLLENSHSWPKRSDTACSPLFLPKTVVAFGIASLFYRPFQSPSFRRTAENVS